LSGAAGQLITVMIHSEKGRSQIKAIRHKTSQFFKPSSIEQSNRRQAQNSFSKAPQGLMLSLARRSGSRTQAQHPRKIHLTTAAQQHGG